MKKLLSLLLGGLLLASSLVACGAKGSTTSTTAVTSDKEVENLGKDYKSFEVAKDALNMTYALEYYGIKNKAEQKDLILQKFEDVGLLEEIPEELLQELKNKYSIIIVTHNLSEAKRIGDQILFFHEGELWERGTKEAFFAHPKRPETKEFLEGEW